MTANAKPLRISRSDVMSSPEFGMVGCDGGQRYHAAREHSRIDNVRCGFITSLFRVRFVHAFLPELLSHFVMFQDLSTLLRVVQLDSRYAFANPVEEELGRCLADSPLRFADFDVIRGGRCEAEGLRVVSDCSH